MVNKFQNTVSSWVRECGRFLFLNHPLRTSLGALIGIGLRTGVILLDKVISKLEWLNLQGLSDWHYIIIGVLFMHIPTIISVIHAKPEFGENIETAFKIIRMLHEQGVEKERIDEMYILVCELYLKQNVITDSKPKDEEKKLLGV